MKRWILVGILVGVLASGAVRAQEGLEKRGVKGYTQTVFGNYPVLDGYGIRFDLAEYYFAGWFLDWGKMQMVYDILGAEKLWS